MSFRDKSIRIDDWAGNLLFIGDYDSPEVDKVLDANRCECRSLICDYPNNLIDACPDCDGTGYSGDFEVQWVDGGDKEGCNVYEYINY